MHRVLPSLRVAIASMAGAVLLLMAVPPPPATAQPQDIALRGFVVSAETGQPLPGAHIVLERLDAPQPSKGTAADTRGYYYLAGIAPGRYTLRVSFVGYQTARDTLRLSGDEEHVTRTVELHPTDHPLDELVITGETRGAAMLEAGRQRVAPRDVARIPTPSVSGDLATYLQSMPGVVSVGDRGGQMFIRGGTPDQNLVLMDKMQIYRPFHIVGFYSAVPQEVISDAEIYAGGFPARYSGYMSSVIDVEMRGGNNRNVEAGATAGPFLTGLRAEGPLNDRGLSLLTVARFSQIERTAPVFLGQEQPLKFNDQFVKLQQSSRTGRCSLNGIHTYDRGLIDPEANDVFSWSNYVFGGRCVGFGANTPGIADVSVSASHTQNAVGEGENPERQASQWTVATKVDVTRALRDQQEIRGGMQLHLDGLSYSLGEKFQGFRAENESWIRINGFIEATLPIGERLDVVPGLAGTIPVGYRLSLEPRLRASWRPFGSENQEVHAAFGFYRQTTVGLSDERDLGAVFTAWVPAPLDRPRPSSWHAILGWNQQIGRFGLTAEGYYKDLQNLAVPIWSVRPRFTTDLTAAEGTSWGIDLRVEFERGPTYAYLGYGFSWIRYSAAQDNFGTWFGIDVQSYHPPHDRRHALNAVWSTNLGFAVADLRWELGSGLPYTKPFGFDIFVRMRDLLESPTSYGTPRLLYEKPYRARLPAYHRLDVSLKRTFDLDGVDLTAKAGAINLYDRQNLFYFDLFTHRRVDQLPLVPFLAVELAID